MPEICGSGESKDDFIANMQWQEFREFVGDLVVQRKEFFPHVKHWTTDCYDSFDAFVAAFPDRKKCETWLNERRSNDAKTRRIIHEEIERLREKGLSYLDIEKLRYEFPGEDE